MKAVVRKFQSEPGQSKNSAFSFSFVHEDGSPLLRSNPYRSKDSAYKGVRAVKKNCTSDQRYIIHRDTNGQHSFQIKSANGIVIVDSVRFSSELEMMDTVNQIKLYIPDCEIDFHYASGSH